MPTEDQLTRAEELLLPRTFYMYEQLQNEGKLCFTNSSLT